MAAPCRKTGEKKMDQVVVRSGGSVEEFGCGCLVFVPDKTDASDLLCPEHAWGRFIEVPTENDRAAAGER